MRHDFGLLHLPSPITSNGPANIDAILYNWKHIQKYV
jgi:hypothetical protein